MPVWVPFSDVTHVTPHHQGPFLSTEVNCEVSLLQQDLWRELRKLDTEMIITKEGRNIFPKISIKVKGLNPDLYYCILVNMVLVGNSKLKFTGTWQNATHAEAQNPHSYYIHPNSPMKGQNWMSDKITFKDLKLTNRIPTPTNPIKDGRIVLSSMHRYQPQIIIVQCDNTANINNWNNPKKIFVFPETQFVAVTAYQNDSVKNLKINTNEFSKGFRAGGRAAERKRLRLEAKQKDDDTPSKSEIIPESSSPQITKTVPEISHNIKRILALDDDDDKIAKKPKLEESPRHMIVDDKIHQFEKSVDYSSFHVPRYLPSQQPPLLTTRDPYYFYKMEQYSPQYQLPYFPHPNQYLYQRPFNYPSIISNYQYPPMPHPLYYYDNNKQISPQPGTLSHNWATNPETAATESEEIDVVGDGDTLGNSTIDRNSEEESPLDLRNTN